MVLPSLHCTIIYHPAVVYRSRRMPFLAVTNVSCCLISLPSVRRSAIFSNNAFSWWVPYVLKKRNRIIVKVKSKYWIRTHKFGIRVPKSFQEAKIIDKQNGDTLCWDSICKEMANVIFAFEEFEGDKKPAPTWLSRIWMPYDI